MVVCLRRCQRTGAIVCGQSVRLLMAILSIGWGIGGPTLADQTGPAAPGKEDAEKKIAWRQLLDRQAGEYTVFVGKDRQHRLGPPKPVLLWANPTRITHFEACTYLWTFKGRPAVVACIFSTHRPGDPLQFCHAFDSLLSEPIVVERGGQRIWYPARSGIEFPSVPDAPAPEQSAVARLRQMKSLAGQFTATLVRWREDEALLMLEAVRKGEGLEWHYGFVRRTSGILDARHRGKLVWHVPTAANRNDPTQPEIYFDVQPRP
jgi:hypothetical protein